VQTDTTQITKYGAYETADRPIVERVAELAGKRGVPMAQIAMAWELQKRPVVAPIVGATKAAHVEQAVAALDVALSDDEIAYLEEPYVPHKVVGAL
jgi:aryl-alcohol dehydrogenase-like predicted oxidoreductase